MPRGRLARLGAFGRLAGGVAGGMLGEGARRIASGERPRMGDLLLTPGNVTRVADQLAHLRGAAMKLGQMISMDAGDLLPPELADILARLRSGARRMPPDQLNRVLAAEWGRDWRSRFARFDATPIAAASIGQVHRATTRDGQLLAIKVQYPGVADSIDADSDNVATLLRMSGLLPRGVELGPLLTEAKAQLREEADYLREQGEMLRFGALLSGDGRYEVPIPLSDLTTARVLAMSFVEGVAVETLVDAPQPVRDAAAGALIALVLRELFSFGAMQTDPNFANYRWQPEAGRLALLDFGAARTVSADTSEAYARVLAAALANDRDAVREAAVAGGFLGMEAVAAHRTLIDRLIDVVLVEVHRPGPLDFGDRAFIGVLREEGAALAGDRATWHLPPIGTLLVQRKISGTALLAARLKARVDVRAMLEAALARRNDAAARTV